MNLEVSMQAALLAGVISFLSPCVLPLVPPYLCFITGASLDELSDGERATAETQKRAVLAALCFVLGFTVVFVALGATASVIAMTLRTHLDLLSKIAGVFIILMGLNFLDVFKIGLFAREARYHHQTQPATYLGAFGIVLPLPLGGRRASARCWRQFSRLRPASRRGQGGWAVGGLFPRPWHSLHAGGTEPWHVHEVPGAL